jgi:hypothetical protein
MWPSTTELPRCFTTTRTTTSGWAELWDGCTSLRACSMGLRRRSRLVDSQCKWQTRFGPRARYMTVSRTMFSSATLEASSTLSMPRPVRSRLLASWISELVLWTPRSSIRPVASCMCSYRLTMPADCALDLAIAQPFTSSVLRLRVVIQVRRLGWGTVPRRPHRCTSGASTVPTTAQQIGPAICTCAVIMDLMRRCAKCR